MTMLTHCSGSQLLELPDCIGLNENGSCNWLDILKCEGAKCPYYQNKGSLLKAQARLCSLTEDVQERIAKKYYNGTRPWEKPLEKFRR